MARGRNAGPGLVSLITVAVSSSVDRTSRVAPLRLVGRGVAGALLYVVLAAASADARPGDVDPSFGAGGFVSTDFGAEDAATDVAVQPDGRIVAVGAFSGDFTVARYRADGSLDPSFDGDGLARTGFGAVDAATSVAIQPDGKIVAAGFTGAGPSPRNFALVRYNANGSLDNGFDGDGMLFTDFGADDVGVDVAVGPGGTIVAAGGTASGTAVDFAFARYDATGAPDNSFDGDGLQTIDFGGLDGLTRAAIQADGRIVAAGLSDAGGDLDIAVARLTAVGAPDPSFDGDGRLTTDIDAFDIAHGVAVQPDGRIVVAGETSTGMGGGLAIVRYQPGGALDPSFGAGGVLIPNLGGQDSPSDVAIQPNGKIVAPVGGAFGFARFNPDGSPDAGFGFGGLASTPFGDSAAPVSLALQPDGKIVGAGGTDAGPNPPNFALVRLAGGEPEPGPGAMPPPACAGRAATIVAAPGVRTNGTSGNDVIVGSARHDRVKAGGGRDLVCTWEGSPGSTPDRAAIASSAATVVTF